MTITTHSLKCVIAQLQDEFYFYSLDVIEKDQKITEQAAEIDFLLKLLIKIANIFGIEDPDQLADRVENDKETYADILIKIIKEKLHVQ